MNFLINDKIVNLDIVFDGNLYKYEDKLVNEYGLKYICGIDEVGRGPLAGPLVCCAVIMKNNIRFKYVNDSKKLSKKKLEYAYNEIMNNIICYKIIEVSPKIIDEINIHQATVKAMKEALDSLSVTPEFVITDYVKINSNLPVLSIKKGDSNSINVACASIIAKVYRDNLMRNYDNIYPGYDFSNNVGYPTAKHKEALKRLGVTPIHRKTFAPVKEIINLKKFSKKGFYGKEINYS